MEFAWNILNCQTFPQRRLMKGNGLVGNNIDFEGDAGLDWEPVKFSMKVFIDVVLGRVSDNLCKRVLILLQLKDICWQHILSYPGQDICKSVQMVVTQLFTLQLIWWTMLESSSNTTQRFRADSMGEMLLPRIYMGKLGRNSLLY